MDDDWGQPHDLRNLLINCVYIHICVQHIYILLYIIYSSPDVLTSLFLFAYRICWSFPVSESKADIVCVLGLPLRASVGFVFQPVPQNMYEEFVQVTLIFFLPIFRSMSKHVQRKDQYRMNELLTIDDYSMYIQYIYNIHTYMYMYAKRGFYLHDR